MAIELLIILAAIPILDWAARWQVENAFAFGLGEPRRVPAKDYWRYAILVGIALSASALVSFDRSGSAAVVGIGFIFAYFSRLIWSAKFHKQTRK